MALNKSTLNSATLNGASILYTGVGSLVDIEQNTVIKASGSLTDIEQVVQFRATGSGSLVDIEQSTLTTAVGSLINIEQQVIDGSLPSHLNRTGWDLILKIDGRTIPTDEISGNLKILRSEGDASLLTFELIPPIGVQDLASYEGKDVTVDVTINAGKYRAYTGIIDIADADILTEKLKFNCTDRRRELINSTLSNVVDSIGYYSETIFGKAEDPSDSLDKRLSTVPKSLDFDPHGNYTLTDWAPKVTADYTFSDSDLYYDRPRVELISRGRIVNKVNLVVNYGYIRNHQRSRTFIWDHPASRNPCVVLANGYSLTKKQTIEEAIRASGWNVNPNGVTYTPIFASGWYSCGGVGSGGGEIGWSTTQTFGSTEAKTDSNGNPISDANGNVIYENTNRTRVVDYSDIYTDGATWVGTKRWVQNIVEQYTLTVESSTSQAVFGVVEEDLSYQLDSNTDYSGWESNSGTDTGGTYAVDNRDNLSEFNNTINTALNVAKTMILMGHRENRAMARTFIKPQLDLIHTVEFSTGPLDAKGKITKLEHVLNIGTGEATTDIEISMYKAGNGGSDSALPIPTKPTDSVPTSFSNITLGNNFGEEPTQAMTGMIGNAFKYVFTRSGFGGGYQRTTYQEEFRVDTPAIEKSVRSTKILEASQSYNIAIPTGTLVVTFDGK